VLVVGAVVAGEIEIDFPRVRAHQKKRNTHVLAGRAAADDFAAQREEGVLVNVDPAVAAAVAAQAREMRALEAERGELAVELKGLRAGRERCRQRGTRGVYQGSIKALLRLYQGAIKALSRLY